MVTIKLGTTVHCPSGHVLVTFSQFGSVIAREAALKPLTNLSFQTGPAVTKVVHIALPVRCSLVGQEGRGPAEFACTYDIYPTGARLAGSRDHTVGDLMLLERGRNKALCQVVWAADPSSPLRGQFAVQCVEGKTPWDDELTQVDEHYQPLFVEDSRSRSFSATTRNAAANRRRRPRFYVEGQAEVIDGLQRVAGEVHQISEYGARIATAEILQPGVDFRLMLNVCDVNLALKAKVKYLVNNLGMGVEFQEIRRGDRPLLDYVLGKVRTRKVEEFKPTGVANAQLVAAS